MKFLICLVSLFVAASSLVAQNPTNRHVVIITVDGFGAASFRDSKTPIPNIRKLAAEGVVAPDGMRVINPSVTWPNHTTLVTGVTAEKHSVIFNGLLVRNGPGKPIWVEGARKKTELVAVPTVYDFLHERGFRTAAINWPCTIGAKSLDFNFPEGEARRTPTETIEKMMQLGLLKEDGSYNFTGEDAAKLDDIRTAAACNVIREQKPDFLLLHLLMTDSTQHRVGPETPEAYAAFAHADNNVGQIISALEQAGIREQTTIFIVADHGFAKADKTIKPNVVLANAGLLEVTNEKITSARAQVVPEGGVAFVYINSPENRAQLRTEITKLFEKLEGIEQVVPPSKFKKFGLPSPDKNPLAPDLMLSAKRGYSFASLLSGEPVSKKDRVIGAHGYVANRPEMNAVFIANGRGIASGKEIKEISNLDIAPTAAYMLGEKFPADGKVLKQIFKKAE